jgi:hypothetical protein
MKIKVILKSGEVIQKKVHYTTKDYDGNFKYSEGIDYATVTIPKDDIVSARVIKDSGDFQVEYWNHLEVVIKDIYSSAISFHSTHQWITEQLNKKVYETKEYKKLSQFWKGCLYGLEKRLGEEIYKYMGFAYKFDDGIIVYGMDLKDERLHTASEALSAFLWKDNDKNFTDWNHI